MTWNVHAFSSTITTRTTTQKQFQSFRISKTFSTSSQLQLIPLSTLDSESKCNFLSTPESYRLCIGTKGQLRPSLLNNKNSNMEKPYYLYIAEEDDLPSISRLTVDAFGAATVTLSSDLNELEKALIGPTVGLWNQYTDTFAFTEVLSGLRSRMKNKFDPSLENNLNPPDISKEMTEQEAFDIAAKSSLILVIAREGIENVSSSVMDIDCVATVELRLQPTDGKIPFSQPWLDKIERKLAKFLPFVLQPQRSKLQPYLSNLCVSPSMRKRQIGKALVRCVETIATNVWGYNRLYLHVDLENEPALNLYTKEGFRDVGFRWNPFWSGKAADIGYYVKKY